MKNVCQEFGIYIKQRRLERGLTQEEVAKMLGIDGKLATSAELKGSNIIPKTIRIQTSGHIKESMSFPTFRFLEIIKRCINSFFSLYHFSLHQKFF